MYQNEILQAISDCYLLLKGSQIIFYDILGGNIVLIHKILTPDKIGWIKYSFLKFSQVRDMAHRIDVP